MRLADSRFFRRSTGRRRPSVRADLRRVGAAARVPALAFVVATKDRPGDLRKMLQSVAAQTVVPAQVVVVDASAAPVDSVIREFHGLRIDYRRHLPPSASAQRNAGLDAISDQVDLIGFADDDIVFEPDAIARMLRFWGDASPGVGGASFNLVNGTAQALGRLKRSRLLNALGLYSAQPGGVAPSGWQGMIETVPSNAVTRWLPSTAVVWRRAVCNGLRFDPFFRGYSYLEDLDFSYSASRRCRLVVVADARYRHYPSPDGRVSAFEFGRVEVRHRLYFVRKHGLSLPRCVAALLLRMGMTAATAVGRLQGAAAGRLAGNLAELVRSTVSPPRPANGADRR